MNVLDRVQAAAAEEEKRLQKDNSEDAKRIQREKKELDKVSVVIHKEIERVKLGLQAVSQGFYQVQQLFHEGSYAGYYRFEDWAKEEFSMSRDKAFMYARIGASLYLNDPEITDWKKLPESPWTIDKLAQPTKFKVPDRDNKAYFKAVIIKVTPETTDQELVTLIEQTELALMTPEEKAAKESQVRFAATNKRKRRTPHQPDSEVDPMFESVAQDMAGKSFHKLSAIQQQQVKDIAARLKPRETDRPQDFQQTVQEPKIEIVSKSPYEQLADLTVTSGDYDLTDHKEMKRLKTELDEAKTEGWKSVEVIYKKKHVATEQSTQPTDDQNDVQIKTSFIEDDIRIKLEDAIKQVLQDFGLTGWVVTLNG